MSLELSGTTGVKGVAGSVSAPSIVGDDTNTGISFPSADTIKFSTGGVERLSISNSGLSGDGSGLTGLTPGITVADIWRSTTSHQGNVSKLANWERPDTGNQGYLGTGVTNSSGTFSFPTTGIWHIQYFAQLYIDNTTSASQRSSIGIMVTTNNSSYTAAAQGHVHWGGGGYSSSISTLGSCTASMLFDCTDVSQQKLQFRFGAGQGFEYIRGDSSYNETYVIFIRLGNT